jgi:hypothetical protein
MSNPDSNTKPLKNYKEFLVTSTENLAEVLKTKFILKNDSK